MRFPQLSFAASAGVLAAIGATTLLPIVLLGISDIFLNTFLRLCDK